MSETRLTTQLAEQIAQSMNITPYALRQGILDGQFKGRKISDRIWLIDDSLIKKDEPQQPELTPVAVVPVAPEVPDDELLEVDRLIKFSKKQQELLSERIKVQELRGHRDLPEKIKQRELDVVERENRLAKLELSLTERETTYNSHKVELDEKYNGTLKYIDERKQEADDYYQSKISEANKYIAQAQKELDKLNHEIDVRKQFIRKLKDIYANTVKPIVKDCEYYLDEVNYEAGQNYHNGERTSGQVSDYYINQANKGFSLSDKLKSIIKYLS